MDLCRLVVCFIFHQQPISFLHRNALIIYIQLTYFTISQIFLSKGKCIVCANPGVADAFYCVECTVLEKDRDGCPKVVNVGTAKIDLIYEKKKYKN